MTSASSTTASTWVAIDVAKLVHQVLIEGHGGRHRSMRIANTASEIERLVTHLQSLPQPCVIAFEPTGDYHRALMHRLGQAGFTLRQVSSLAVARTRDAMYNSWDKNDPKDAQVILHLLKTGTTQRFVDPLVSGHRDSFEVGCSHSWTGRIVWDPRTRRYVTVCATDNACRIAQPNPYRTVAAGACDGTLFGGDLVLAKAKGYWTAWSQGGRARLAHFTTGKADTNIGTAAGTRHPHLVGYGSGRMLLAWQSGSATAAQVYDSGTGKAVGARLTIGVRDHDYQAFKSYPDGSVAYPAAGSTGTSIRIARVLPSTM